MRKMVMLALALSLPAMARPMLAQQLSRSQGIPIPSQLLAAHTVFVAPAGFNAVGAADARFASYLFQSLSSAVTNVSHYTLKASPAEADLSLRISVVTAAGAVSSGSNIVQAAFRVEIYDSHSGILLWTVEEYIQVANRTATAYKNIDAAAERITADLNALSDGKLPSAYSATPNPSMKENKGTQ